MTSSPISRIPTDMMAMPVYVAEEVAVGRCVFQHFIQEEFQEEGVSDEILEEVVEEEEIVEEDDATDRMAAPGEYIDENFANALHHVGASGMDTNIAIQHIGTSIRELANEFAKSQERKRLKMEADKVDVASITHEGFFTLCEEVFRDGITRTHLIALFYFCADVLKKCVVSEMKEIAIRLFKWALEYIVDRVCAWVAKHGGWEKAIRNSFPPLSPRQLLVMSAAFVGICAVSGLVIYKLKS